MTSRGISRVRAFGTRNLTRAVVAGIVLAGSPLAMAGTANAATPKAPTASDDVWDQIAQCESGGRWNTNTGNGYSGGLQFSPSTWRAYGGKGSASGASRAEQIAVAERVVSAQGWGAWPVCSRKVNAKAKSSARSVAAQKRQPSASRNTQTQVQPSAPKVAAVPGANYTVAPGDTLSKIAQQRNVPGGWQALYDHNRAALTNPNALKVGQQLVI
jgi:resuscitation-promoting factor RpfA